MIGYHKIEKSTTAPLKQMHSIFNKDCIIADKIKIVGYSFGDEYINDHLINALSYNANLSENDITIIDPVIKDHQYPKPFLRHLRKINKINKGFGDFLETVQDLNEN